MNDPADSIGFKLANKPISDPATLGHVHLDECMVFGTNDTVACGAFPGHLQVRELTEVILLVKAWPTH